MVPHAYGDHSSCGNWCGYLKNPASYKHRGLPHGKDLTDKSLRQSLEKIIEVSTVYMMYMYSMVVQLGPHKFPILPILVEEHTSKKKC